MANGLCCLNNISYVLIKFFLHTFSFYGNLIANICGSASIVLSTLRLETCTYSINYFERSSVRSILSERSESKGV